MGSTRPPVLTDAEEETHTSSAPMHLPKASTRTHASLMVLSGSNTGRTYRLAMGATVLGRSSRCKLHLDDQGISRSHVRFIRTRDGVVLEDLESANGTYVNGERVRTAIMEEGDKVRLGTSTLLKFTYLDDLDEAYSERMYVAAVRDAATKAFNRHYLMERLEAELAYARRHRSPLCVCMADLDFFKRINDEHGHLAGDYVLARLVHVMQGALRTEDVLARYGGEEFAVVCRGLDAEAGLRMANRLRKTVEQARFRHKRARLEVTVSIGVATYPLVGATSREELLEAADAALYEAKRAGRNRVAIAPPQPPRPRARGRRPSG